MSSTTINNKKTQRYLETNTRRAHEDFDFISFYRLSYGFYDTTSAFLHALLGGAYSNCKINYTDDTGATQNTFGPIE